MTQAASGRPVLAGVTRDTVSWIARPQASTPADLDRLFASEPGGEVGAEMGADGLPHVFAAGMNERSPGYLVRTEPSATVVAIVDRVGLEVRSATAADRRASAYDLAVPFDPSTHPHRRRNPLTGRWVIVSPQRTQRPWVGQRSAEPSPAPSYDPECYLCPGNERAGGIRNPDYDSTFVFENDFAALLPGTPAPERSVADPEIDELFGLAGATGECRVLCFSPRHDLTLADMTPDAVAGVIELWQSQLVELRERYQWVQIFETRGAISGASNPHPHGQIWASTFLPDEILQELEHQRTYLDLHGRPMLLDYVERELERGDRVVTSNDDWAVVVPYWAYWPFETLVLPRRPLQRLDELDVAGRESLTEVLQRMLRGFDALFETPFPYCSGWHTAPEMPDPAGWQLHAHYYPPLLRSADVAKIPASYELLANLQRDITPEAAAAELRAVTPTL